MDLLSGTVVFRCDPEVRGLSAQTHGAGEAHDFFVFERREGSPVPVDDVLELVLWGGDAEVIDRGLHGDWLSCSIKQTANRAGGSCSSYVSEGCGVVCK